MILAKKDSVSLFCEPAPPSANTPDDTTPAFWLVSVHRDINEGFCDVRASCRGMEIYLIFSKNQINFPGQIDL